LAGSAFSAKGKRKSLHSGIQKLNRKSPIFDGMFLPNQLIKAMFHDSAIALLICIRAMICSGCGPIQADPKAHRLAGAGAGSLGIWGSKHHMQVAGMEAEDNAPRFANQHRFLASHGPSARQTPLV
jgi:hypothetical protein